MPTYWMNQYEGPINFYPLAVAYDILKVYSFILILPSKMFILCMLAHTEERLKVIIIL